MSKFAKMQSAIERRGYSAESAAKITAAAGDKKYGTQVMGKAAHAGISADAMKRRMEKMKGNNE